VGRLKKALLLAGGLIGIPAVALIITAVAASSPMPEGGEPGAAADELAHRLEAVSGADGWSKTMAITWTHGGRSSHLWDRHRNYDRVRWKDYEVLLDITGRRGIAREHGQAVTGEKRAKLVERAWALWANDSFWLNPLVKLFDEGVSRKKIDRPTGESGLLVTYSSGGVTPGDSYFWILPKDGLPTAWRMWVSILPIKGLMVSWDRWETLPTGARISTEHHLGPITLELTGLRGAERLEELTGATDPFAPLGSAE
jgi:hypothetical protein